MLKKIIAFAIVFICLVCPIYSQQGNMSADEIMIRLQKLNTLGSVLYFAAHPDDENTRLIAWLAQERKYKTAYLSLTRGDGGQNLIGTEQGIDLGLVRTEELLAARAIDKGEQYFSSAYDFGFSKTHQETFDFWDKETALREAVWLIRKLRPDIIINRFPPDKRGGHGHHQASAILAHEAYLAAADPNRFPKQLKTVTIWQAKRLLWNTANFGGINNTSDDQLQIDIGAYSPLLGESFGEIAARSRSQHKSQGFGAAGFRGKNIEYFEHVAGDKAQTDLMDGITTSWDRIVGASDISAKINQIIENFKPTQPQHSIKGLFELRDRINQITDNYWKNIKLKEVDDIIAACAGLWIDATTPALMQAVDSSFPVLLEVIVRNPDIKAQLLKTNLGDENQSLETNSTWSSTKMYKWAEITQPYWLKNPHSLGKFDVKPTDVGYPNNAMMPKVTFTFLIDGHELVRSQKIQHRHVDPVRGEVHSPLTVTPPLTVEVSSSLLLSTNGQEKFVDVIFHRHNKQIDNFTVNIPQPQGWETFPKSIPVTFKNLDKITHRISVKPNSTNSPRATVELFWNDKPLKTIQTIDYDHIPRITWFPNATIDCENLNLVNPVKTIGYIAGAGDRLPESLAEIGIEVTHLNNRQLSVELLSQYDAIIVGVRYFNVDATAATTQETILEYVKQGGVALFQYNVNTALYTKKIGPYPFSISRDRVTDEHAAVHFDDNDPAYNYPNKLSEADFSNWIQERGLYFASNIDPKYRTPIRMNDKGEPASNGSLLITNYGKGKFVYTSLSFFRQLPVGVPGAYRLFVNLLTKEKTIIKYGKTSK